MARLGDNRYGKAQIRLMKVDRDTERHVLHDLNVSISLSGDMEEVHLTGDNATVHQTCTDDGILSSTVAASSLVVNQTTLVGGPNSGATVPGSSRTTVRISASIATSR